MAWEIKHRYSGVALLRGEGTLSGADLSCADLSCADLSCANLFCADLSCANLSCADLSCANLSCANLSCADLSCADLRSANLRSANLRSANLRSANLRSANLRSANLCGANGADWAIAVTRILPEGSIVGWKKCRGEVLVKLLIPAEAKRVHAFGRKCRAEFADVLEVIGADEGHSGHDRGKTVYRVGERVRPDSFCDDWMRECAPGIHFFITRAEAEAY